MGILDCDIFGPSLPILLKHENDRSAPFFLALTALVMAYNESTWLPFKLQNMLCMSFGWMSSMTSSNIMRGPMVMSIIEQILNNTMWGDLDYLILDLPPGTGDVQLSLCQKLSLSGSVIVTTPQILSVADTEKGIRMFGKLKVPINALVENMSFFKVGDLILQDLSAFDVCHIETFHQALDVFHELAGDFDFRDLQSGQAAEALRD